MTVPITLLHATPVAIEPVHAAFRTEWPEAEPADLLDSGLTTARARTPELTGELTSRFVALARYARSTGPAGILATCSAFGKAIEQADAELDVPVVKPNEAMFRAALAHGTSIGMLATFAPSVASMEEEFAAIAQGVPATLRTVLVPGALDVLRAGDAEAHNRLVAAAAPNLADVDAIVLAHFSTARAAPGVREAVAVPVFTAPESAVRALRVAVGG
ncbi:aspartate/glutamate racemase family protein [Amycolatopsis magusensis]|uniref:Asp/Glu/hydantoin racemase n=1 Tax=Amycolatopsis magusensis TaxID=882444 RepID=A0ABS4PYK0_9PSEU|nr:aspartate/glutamate racemase family protein [Amycolatopsis magusensis]MBP2183626.1 Asp/Glu/hydantoin racemase [Amycolatopsis magusensis]